MNDIQDFFNINKPLKVVLLPSPQVGPNIKSNTGEEQCYYEEDVEDNDPPQYDYAAQYIQEEETYCMENNMVAEEDNILRPDTPTTAATGTFQDLNIIDEAAETLYEKYNVRNRRDRPELAINSFEEHIVDMICTNSVVILQGPTGCGKTTQVPQYILDYCQRENKYCKIAVTQPRRIAALTVAKRVSEERGWTLGTVVGYQVGLKKEVSSETLITYMTTGIMLQKLIAAKNLNQYTHIIIDEVHERDADMDFLLLVVRKFLRTVSKTVKIILMSATYDVDHFSKYFLVSAGTKLVPAPVIDITKEQPHSVNIYYFNQFTELLDARSKAPRFEREEPTLNESLKELIVELLRAFDRVDHANENHHGSVLVFLPGIFEIEDIYQRLDERNKQNDQVKWHIVPLHSSITAEEQNKAFETAPDNYRKVILTTNIAESSITVPDVSYVIDSCLTRVLISDPSSNYTSLKLVWASHTNCNQRSGRVGRVRPGRVYRLVTESFFYEQMERDITPEMLRSPLHTLVLMAKSLNLNTPPHGILALAIDVPKLKYIEKTIAILKECGALLTTCRGVYDKLDGDLTIMGRVMARLPLDIHVSKLIVLGHQFSTLREAIIMGAGMCLQNIFTSPFQERLKSYAGKLTWADCSSSDLIAYFHVYQVWERKRHSNLYRISGSERNWMKKNFLQAKTMREWRVLITEIKHRLSMMGIEEPLEDRSSDLSKHEKAMMLKVVISGAFYPNYFVRSSEGGQIDEGLAVRELGGRDPFTTVYFKGKPENQPTQLYVQSVRELLKDCSQNMLISYDTSNKIYVQFKHDWLPDWGTQVPGKISTEVYLAVKHRHLRLPTTIRCLSAEESNYRVRQWEEIQAENKIKTDNSPVLNVLPSLEDSIIELSISFINNPGHFFAHNVTNLDAMAALQHVESVLNQQQLDSLDVEVSIGLVCAAEYMGKYYRARIVHFNIDTKLLEADILYIDYGNVQTVMVKDLKKIDPELVQIPPLALSCVLSHIQPSLDKSPHAIWTTEAKNRLENMVLNKRIYGKVYSVVDGVVSVELYLENRNPNPTRPSKSVNERLVEIGLAQAAIESFLSQDDHKNRERVQALRSTTEDMTHYTPYIKWYDTSNEMPAPDPNECRFSIDLKGPHSPLEMQIYSVVQCSLTKNVGVEWSSVNSVLLDTDPQDPHDRLLVAGSVSQTMDGQKLSLRHTTVMPNMHGFPAIMALLFCPNMTMHVNREGTRVTSILCGLGADPETHESLFPAHDLALNIDFEITEQTITLINQIRYFMNQSLESMEAINAKLVPGVTMDNCQREIRSNVRNLLNIQHNKMDRIIMPNIYQWYKPLPEGVRFYRPTYDTDGKVWSVHPSVTLVNIKEREVQANKNRIQDMINGTAPISTITCKVCNILLEGVPQMRLHLAAANHKTNEAALIM